MNWIILSSLALVFFGLWGVFPKISNHYLSPKSVFIYEALGFLIAGIITFFFMKCKVDIHTKGIVFGVLTGLAAGFGSLFFIAALSRGKASVTVTLTALYPLITILLSVLFLKESFSLKQGLGMLLALAAMVLLAA